MKMSEVGRCGVGNVTQAGHEAGNDGEGETGSLSETDEGGAGEAGEDRVGNEAGEGETSVVSIGEASGSGKVKVYVSFTSATKGQLGSFHL